jgi:hypothetical protein
VVRKRLGLSQAQVTDAELVLMFDAMDGDASGQVSLGEFAAFAKGAAQSSNYHGTCAPSRRGFKPLKLFLCCFFSECFVWLGIFFAQAAQEAEAAARVLSLPPSFRFCFWCCWCCCCCRCC